MGNFLVHDVMALVSYAFLAAQGNGVRIIDIGNESSMTERGYYYPYGSVESLALSDDYIYAVTQDAGMFILEFLMEPAIHVSTENISFGEVYVGEFKDSTITISNIGTDILIIDSIASTDTDFTVQYSTNTLMPGQSSDATLRFAPSSAGSITANLLFSGNWPSSTFNIQLTGTGTTLTHVKKLEGVPNEFTLSQNFPNPFNPSTQIYYGLPVRSHVFLEIVDALGRRVEVLIDDEQEAGYYSTTWIPDRTASGVYFYRLQTDKFSDTKKLILLR